MVDGLIDNITGTAGSLSGRELVLNDRVTGREILRQLNREGYSAVMIGAGEGQLRIVIGEYLKPARLTDNGFFEEGEELSAHLYRELQKAPYHMKDDTAPAFLLTERQRSWHEDVLGFCPGPIRDDKHYHHDYRYMTPGVLLYSNFEACIRMVIPDFDIYGPDYTLSSEQWERLKAISAWHGDNAGIIARELNEWRREYLPHQSTALTILCI